MGTSERTRTQRALPEAVASENEPYVACCAVLHAGTLGRHGGQGSSKADTTSQLLTPVPSEGNRNILCSTYPRTRRRMRDSRYSRRARTHFPSCPNPQDCNHHYLHPWGGICMARAGSWGESCTTNHRSGGHRRAFCRSRRTHRTSRTWERRRRRDPHQPRPRQSSRAPSLQYRGSSKKTRTCARTGHWRDPSPAREGRREPRPLRERPQTRPPAGRAARTRRQQGARLHHPPEEGGREACKWLREARHRQRRRA